MMCVVESLCIPFFFKSGTPLSFFYMYIITFFTENFKYRCFLCSFSTVISHKNKKIHHYVSLALHFGGFQPLDSVHLFNLVELFLQERE